MPETRLLAQHQPRTTTLPRTQAIPHPGANATAGSFVSASPAAGGYVHAQVAAARHALGTAPGGRPPGAPPQAARVDFVPRPGAAPAVHAQGGALLASNARPTVQIIPKVTSQTQTQIPPGGGVPFDLDEAMLVGQLLNQYVEGAASAKDHANAQLGSRALGKISTNVQILMEMMAHSQAAYAAAQAAAGPQPTRVQVPSQPTMPAQAPGMMAVAGQPTVQILPNQTVPVSPAPPPGWPQAASWPQAWQNHGPAPQQAWAQGQPAGQPPVFGQSPNYGQPEAIWPPAGYAAAPSAQPAPAPAPVAIPAWPPAGYAVAPSAQPAPAPAPVVIQAWPPAAPQGAAGTPGVYPWPPRPVDVQSTAAPTHTADPVPTTPAQAAPAAPASEVHSESTADGAPQGAA